MANHLCLSASLIRELTGQAPFPKSSFPREPLPSSLRLESTFQLCFSSCTCSHMLCRLGMWTAHLSMLCAYCHIQFSDTTPRRIHYLPEVLKRSLQLPARSQSWLISSCGFGFFFLFLIRILSFLCVLVRSCKTFVVKAWAVC